MKKNLLRFVAICAAGILMLTSMIVPVTAEGNDDHLIVHYDFNGDTEIEMLADKAPNDASDNDLKKYGDVTVKNGVATMNGGKSNYLQANGKGTDDFKDKTAYTIVIRYRASGTHNSWTNLYKLTYLSRCFYRSATEIELRNGNCNSTTFKMAHADGWQTLAVTVDYSNNSSTGGYVGTTYANGSFGVTEGKDPYAETQINLGNQGGSVTESMTFEIDDFRVYDSILSEDDVNQIHLGLCAEKVAPVTASSEALAKPLILEQLASVLECEASALSLTDTVFVAGKSLTATVNYNFGGKSVTLTGVSFDVNAPKAAYVGYQVSSSLASDETFSIRFIGSVAGLNFEGAGLEITSAAKDASWTTQETKTVYTTLTGKTGDSKIVEYSAPDGSYFTAYTIEGIPADTTDTFTVRTFVIENGETVWGETYELTFNGYAMLNIAD